MHIRQRICQGRPELSILERLELWLEPDGREEAHDQMARGLVGQRAEYGGDPKCNRKPVEGSREKWAFIFVKTLNLGSYVKGGIKDGSEPGRSVRRLRQYPRQETTAAWRDSGGRGMTITDSTG